MKKDYCARCESVGRESRKNATHPVIFNRIDTLVCDECFDEINNEYEEKLEFLNEIQENEDLS